MRAGAYDEIVDIYKVVVTRNEYGEQHDDYEYRCTTRANVVQTGGTRSVQNDEVLYPYNRTFIIHSYIKVDEFDYIKWRGHFYRILSIDYEEKVYNHKKILTELVNE